ncbi:MAG: 30S ribosomal protein S6 [Parcubacteria group bacterium]|nr:30S ribosomal protein S6 [Parcubacteria group bacterium]
MKLYELYMVLRPDLSEADLGKTVSEATDFCSKNGFEVTASKTKERERLPYPVKHFTEGHMVSMDFSGSNESVFPEEAEAYLRHNENILRHLVMAKSEKMLKKIKPLPAFEPRPFRPERKPVAAGETITRGPEIKTEPVPLDIEGVDKKLEELLK